MCKFICFEIADRKIFHCMSDMKDIDRIRYDIHLRRDTTSSLHCVLVKIEKYNVLETAVTLTYSGTRRTQFATKIA